MKRSLKAVTLILMLVALLGIFFVPTKAYAAGEDAAEATIVKVTKRKAKISTLRC